MLGAGSADVTTEFQRGHTAVSAFWGLVALTALYAGLSRGAQSLRLAGFALFGAALVKLFLYDLSALSSVTARAVVPRGRGGAPARRLLLPAARRAARRRPAAGLTRLARIARMRYDASALERLRAKVAGAENGWFFAQIADRVAERRKEVGLSQQQLAMLTGTTQSAIARLEKGGRPPRIDTLMRIAEALDCDLVVELRPR